MARLLRKGESCRGQGARKVGELVPLVVQPVPDLLGSQAGEEQVGAQLGVRGAGLVKQLAAVLAPEGVRAGAQPGPGSGGLREQDEVQLPLQKGQVAGDEGGEPRRRISPGTKRRRPGQDLLLELALPLVQQCNREAARVTLWVLELAQVPRREQFPEVGCAGPVFVLCPPLHLGSKKLVAAAAVSHKHLVSRHVQEILPPGCLGISRQFSYLPLRRERMPIPRAEEVEHRGRIRRGFLGTNFGSADRVPRRKRVVAVDMRLEELPLCVPHFNVRQFAEVLERLACAEVVAIRAPRTNGGRLVERRHGKDRVPKELVLLEPRPDSIDLAAFGRRRHEAVVLTEPDPEI